MELVKDVIEPVIQGETVVVTRTIIEKMDVEEYLRRLGQLVQQQEGANKQIAGMKTMYGQYVVQKEAAEKIAKDQQAKAKAEREAALKKEVDAKAEEPKTQ